MRLFRQSLATALLASIGLAAAAAQVEQRQHQDAPALTSETTELINTLATSDDERASLTSVARHALLAAQFELNDASPESDIAKQVTFTYDVLCWVSLKTGKPVNAMDNITYDPSSLMRVLESAVGEDGSIRVMLDVVVSLRDGYPDEPKYGGPISPKVCKVRSK